MRTKDNSFKIVTGRPRNKPWEQKQNVSFRLEQATYQRIRRFAEKRKCGVSEALEMLLKTSDSELIEPTLAVDYSHLLEKIKTYAITNILDPK